MANRNIVKTPSGNLPKLRKAATSQAFASQSPAPAGVASYPKSTPGPSTPSVTDDADAMVQQKKIAGRRFGIHAPHASNPRPKGV